MTRRFLTAREQASLRTADEDYRGRHRGPDPEYGASLDNVESMFPDYHTHPEYYRTYQPYDYQSESKILKYRGRPDARVDIYRALPLSAAVRQGRSQSFPLNKGDWVTTSYDYAKEHGESNLDSEPWTILHTKVPASQLFTEGNSIHEWAYQGENSLASEHPTARGQRYRRQKRTAGPKSYLNGPEEAYDEWDWFPRHEQHPPVEAEPGLTWYHVSPADLKPGTVLAPFRGAPPWGDDPYQGGLGNRANWVWVEHDENKSRAWMHWVLEHQAQCRLYRVTPRLGPYAWNGSAVEGWVTDSAVVEELLLLSQDVSAAPKG